MFTLKKPALWLNSSLALIAGLIMFSACSAPAESPNTTPSPEVSASPGASASPGNDNSAPDFSVSFAEVAPIVEQRCAACHSENPSITRFGKPAGGIALETPEQIKAQANRIKARAVQTQGMPVSNLTNMTEAERELLGRWIDAGASLQ